MAILNNQRVLKTSMNILLSPTATSPTSCTAAVTVASRVDSEKIQSFAHGQLETPCRVLLLGDVYWINYITISYKL